MQHLQPSQAKKQYKAQAKSAAQPSPPALYRLAPEEQRMPKKQIAV